METKICSKCKEEKLYIYFGKDKRRKDGYRLHCNDCRKLESKIYRDKHPEKRKKTISKYYSNNKEIIKEKHLNYKSLNHEKIKEIKNNSYHKNKDKHKERIKQYRQTKKKERAKYQKMLLETNIIYKISQLCRSRILKLINKTTKNEKSFNIIGCSPEFLKEYLEKQFKDGMSWDNYGFYGWHIDHIIPLSSAKTEEEVYKLCHYTNLQPLWAEDNLKKGSKII
jgi:hypothetical protein